MSNRSSIAILRARVGSALKFARLRGARRVRSGLARSLRLITYLTAPGPLLALFLRHGAALAITWTVYRFLVSTLSLRVKRLVRMAKGLDHYRQHHKIRSLRRKASTYSQWLELSRRLDRADGLDAWRATGPSDARERKATAASRRELDQLVSKGDAFDLMWFLRRKVTRVLPGPAEIYKKLYTGGATSAREALLRSVVVALRRVISTESKTVASDDKLTFFHHLRHSFGRSCLCLSGGATLGMYHVGVVKALFDAGCLPRIVSGSSVGAIIAGTICTRSPDRLKVFLSDPYAFDLDFFSGDSVLAKLSRAASRGAVLDSKALERCIRANVGEMTFEEAHDVSGLVANIVVTSRDRPSHSLLCNFLTTPNVLVWSAAMCSCSLPGIYGPATLFAKDRQGRVVSYDGSEAAWVDGSIHSDVPNERLGQLFNVRYRIVSQVNPHVVTLLGNRRPWWPERALLRALQYLGHELRGLLVSLSRLGLPVHRYLLGLLDQEYFGDVTIRPKINLSEFMRLFSNPTRPELTRAIAKGRRETWKHLGEILAHGSIEAALNECVHAMTARVKEAEPGEADGTRAGQSPRQRLSWSVGDFLNTPAAAGPMPGVLGARFGALGNSRSLANLQVLRQASKSQQEASSRGTGVRVRRGEERRAAWTCQGQGNS